VETKVYLSSACQGGGGGGGEGRGHGITQEFGNGVRRGAGLRGVRNTIPPGRLEQEGPSTVTSPRRRTPVAVLLKRVFTEEKRNTKICQVPGAVSKGKGGVSGMRKGGCPVKKWAEKCLGGLHLVVCHGGKLGGEGHLHVGGQHGRRDASSTKESNG